MALGALLNGCVEVVDGLQGDVELADQGLNQKGSGRDDTLIGGQGWRE